MKTVNNKTISIKKRNWIPGTRKTVYQYDPNLELIAVYDSVAEATRFTGIHKNTISNSIKEKHKSLFFIWSDKLL
jgi:hypothetical protein